MPSGSTRGVRSFSLTWLAAALFLLGCLTARAETVATLPTPTGYVSDFANVIDPASRQQIEALCAQLDHQANAQVAVVTINSLDGDDIDDFAVRLEEKWKVGRKGTDRGILMLFAVNDRKVRIEVGYGLEGILNDAKAGDILRSIKPIWDQGRHAEAISSSVQQVGQIIADDAHIILTPTAQVRQVHRQQGGGSILPFIIIVVVVLLIVGSRAGGGPGGLMYFLLGTLLGGVGRDGREGEGHTGGWSGGGGFGDGGGGGGGFGGFGGGSSGGGGASGDL